MTTERPEAEYLKSNDIGLVIAKGMAVTYKADPENPVDFFARWLLNQSHQARNQLLQEERAIKVKETRDKHKHDLKIAEKDRKADEKQGEERANKIREFNEKVESSRDLEDELPALVDHLVHFTGATAVYIGKVVKPIKKITDSSDDRAHLDEDAPPQIQFCHASGSHAFMKDKVLK